MEGTGLGEGRGVGEGRGKVILLGEHAVVYGHPALAAAAALGVRAVAVRSEAHRLRVDAWGVDTATQPGGPVERAFAALREALGIGGAWDVTCDATVPPRAGLGSSAAMSVAVARALADAAYAPGVIGLDGIEAASQAAERVFHGNPSGIDVALAARGGIGVFERGKGLTRLPVRPFRIAIGLTGEPRDTAARVTDVARRREQDPVDTDRRLATLGGYVREAARGLDPLATGMLGDLAPAAVLTRFFAHAQRELAALGLSSPGIDRLCAIAAGVGAAAKLTGAGGGGAVIALGGGQEQRVVDAWRAEGFDARLVEIGVGGPAS